MHVYIAVIICVINIIIHLAFIKLHFTLPLIIFEKFDILALLNINYFTIINS